MAALTELAKEQNVGLILLDPLISRLGKKLDTHKDGEVRVALEPFVRLADEAKASIIGIIHVNKGSSADMLNSIMGSRAFTAVPRSILGVIDNPEDSATRLFGQLKNNAGPELQCSFVFRVENTKVGEDPDDGQDIEAGRLVQTGILPKALRDVIQEQTASNTNRPHDIKDAAVVWLRARLKSGGVMHSILIKEAEAAGFSRSTLRRAAGSLGVKVTTIGTETEWSLRKETSQEPKDASKPGDFGEF
jgi:hypothetical protein